MSNKHNLTCQLSNVFAQCTQDYPQNFSSHDPVFATLLVPCAEQATSLKKYSDTYSDFSKSRVIWDENNLEEYRDTAAKVLSEYESAQTTS